jgi:UDP-N-acetylglucosamine 2-epimerase
MDRYRKNKLRNEGPCTIVLTTQNLEAEKLIAFVAEFLEIADGQLDCSMYFKLHPSERNKEPYTSVFGNNERIYVILNKELPPTLELLAKADYHVSIYSTCHYEALALGTPTLILPFAGHQVMSHILETGYAFLVRTPQDMLNVILKSGRRKVASKVSEYYFAPGALENMKRELGILPK